jgi:hypothetical protein
MDFVSITVMLVLGLTLVFVRPGAAAGEPNEALLKEKTEQLFLNYKLLDSLYKNLREVTSAYIYQPDQQLNYMQKLALFVNEARLTSYYQWQMFSVMEYIKPEYRKDYHTLRSKDLKRAKTDLTFLLSMLDLYAAFIENKAALQPVEEAVINIKGTVYLFEGLLQILQAPN